jgi:hypothetical protein
MMAIKAIGANLVARNVKLAADLRDVFHDLRRAQSKAVTSHDEALSLTWRPHLRRRERLHWGRRIDEFDSSVGKVMIDPN